MEIAGYHIVFIAYAYHVGIRIVGIEHRIDISAIALVAPLKTSLRMAEQHTAQHHPEQGFPF